VPQLTTESIKSIVYTSASSQSLSARNNYSCAFHNFNQVNHTLKIAGQFELELLPYFDSIATELNIQPQQLHEVMLLLPLGLGFRDICFEIDDIGIPLANNKMKSWVRLLTTMGSMGYELTNEVFHILRSIILHTSNDQFKGDPEVQFAQLLVELCTYSHISTIVVTTKNSENKCDNESIELDDAIVRSILYLIELELRRTQPLTPGSAFNRANSYFNEQGYENIANKSISSLAQSTRDLLIVGTQSKLTNSIFVNSKTLLTLLEKLFSTHLEMVNSLELMIKDSSTKTSIHKQMLSERALLSLDIPSVY
jgi:hypothetical protein